jgi:hypothetical protein
MNGDRWNSARYSLNWNRAWLNFVDRQEEYDIDKRIEPSGKTGVPRLTTGKTEGI